MKLGRAVIAGLVGGVVVIVAMIIAGAISGTDADLCRLAGAVITGRESGGSWLVGCVAQLAIAIVAALVYAGIFEWILRRAGVLAGLAIALGHVVIAGIAVGFLPVSGMLSAGMSPPGAFLEYRGWPVIGTFVVAHLVFGAIVGALYGQPVHRVSAQRATWRSVPADSV
jgi:hypothetical protein